MNGLRFFVFVLALGLSIAGAHSTSASSHETSAVQGMIDLDIAIAIEIIEQHDGRIGVDSKPGQGSVFYFNLPLADQPGSGNSTGR